MTNRIKEELKNREQNVNEVLADYGLSANYTECVKNNAIAQGYTVRSLDNLGGAVLTL